MCPVVYVCLYMHVIMCPKVFSDLQKIVNSYVHWRYQMSKSVQRCPEVPRYV